MEEMWTASTPGPNGCLNKYTGPDAERYAYHAAGVLTATGHPADISHLPEDGPWELVAHFEAGEEVPSHG